VSSHFEGNRATGVILAKLPEGLAVIGDGELFENRSILVSDADMVFLVAEVDADLRFELLTRVFCF